MRRGPLGSSWSTHRSRQHARRTRPLAPLRAESYGDAGIPVVMVKRSARTFACRISRRKRGPGRAQGFAHADQGRGVQRWWPGSPRGSPNRSASRGSSCSVRTTDHLGMGGRGSRRPGEHEPHVGADDNALGTAALLEAARSLASRKSELRRDVIFTSFSGQEWGPRPRITRARLLRG